MNTFRVPHVKGARCGAAVLRAFLPFLSSDPTRYALQFVHVRQGFAYATDGHKLLRAHASLFMAEGGPLPDGAYKPVKDGRDFLLQADEGAGPSFEPENVIPKTWAKSFEFWTTEDHASQHRSGLLYELAREGVSVDFKHVDALPAGSWTVGLQDSPALRPILFLDETFLAVVMPMRHEDKPWTVGTLRRATSNDGIKNVAERADETPAEPTAEASSDTAQPEPPAPGTPEDDEGSTAVSEDPDPDAAQARRAALAAASSPSPSPSPTFGRPWLKAA